MHLFRHMRTSSVMQSLRTGNPQTSVNTEHTCCISRVAHGPLAPTRTLSRNRASERVFPRRVCHNGCPRGENVRLPRRRIRSTRFLTPQTDRRSALWALNGPPMGMAPVRAQIWPDACVYVSVNNEKYTRFSSSVWGRCVERLDVPRPARSSFLLSRRILQTISVAFQRRRCASHATDSDRSCIIVVGFMSLNWPEQSHSLVTSQSHSGKPCIQGCSAVMFKTRNEALISSVRMRSTRVNARATSPPPNTQIG